MTEPESPSVPTAWTPPHQPWAPPGNPQPAAPGWAPPGSVWPQPWAPPGSAWPPPGAAWPPPGTSPVVFTTGIIPPQPRRRRGPRLAVGIGAAVVVVLGLVIGLGVMAIRAVNRDIAGARNAATPTSTPAANPLPTTSSSTPAPVPATNLDVALQTQSKAMIADDETGWMALIDPHATAAVAEYRRIFHNLRQMKVAAWQQSPLYNDLPVVVAPRTFGIDVQYCLITAPCTMMDAIMTVTAQLRDGQVRIEGFEIPKRNTDFYRPLPWMVANLSAAVDTGAHVVVAASSAEAGHLASALRGAVSAAKTVGPYAHWGKPDVYVVYLADHTEAKLWFGSMTDITEFTCTSYPVSPTDIETVLVMPGAADGGPGELGGNMRWSMGLTALEFGSGGNGNSSLGNGLADYIANTGYSQWTSDDVANVRSWVRTGKWNRSVSLTTEMQSSDNETRWGANGIGYLAIRHLIQRFGLAKTLDFWGDVERLRYPLDEASKAAFGLSWTSVNADCVSYIEHLI